MKQKEKVEYVFIVTDKLDPYSLPVFVGNSMQEVADFLKTKRDTCFRALCYGNAVFGRYLIEKIYLTKE